MNKIYDYNEIQEIDAKQKKLILRYIICLIAFFGLIVLACVYIKNIILLTVLFAISLLIFIFYSIIFWKIKYGILKKYKLFLDQLETGKASSYIGSFKGKLASESSEEFEKYIFTTSNKSTHFLVYNHKPIDFIEGEKYHIECVGSYICQWESVE